MYDNIVKKKVLDNKDDILNKVKHAYGDNLDTLVLFGSITRPDFSINSDIDMFIILKDSPLSLRQRIDEFYKRVGYYFKEHFLSPLILTEKEAKRFHPFYLGVFDSYIILYDKRNHVTDIINTIKQKIASKEIIELNHPKKHWIIKDAKA